MNLESKGFSSPPISNNISLRGNSSDSLLSRISTWKISNLHVDIFYFPRGRDSFPPKFHFIPPKNFFFPTWEIKILHVDISKYPRGNHFSPTQPCIDTCPTLNYCCEPTSSRRAPLPIKSKTSPCRDAREYLVGGRPLSNGNSIVALTGTDALRLDTPVCPYWVRPASPIVPCVPTR